jgi:hypothetical protein
MENADFVDEMEEFELKLEDEVFAERNAFEEFEMQTNEEQQSSKNVQQPLDRTINEILSDDGNGVEESPGSEEKEGEPAPRRSSRITKPNKKPDFIYAMIESIEQQEKLDGEKT